MKRFICIILFMAVFVCSIAAAEAMDARLLAAFDRCKQSLLAMSCGDFDGAVSSLHLDASYADRLNVIANNKCPVLMNSAPQTDYAVAWMENGSWYLSVPVNVPSYKNAPCAVFALDGGYEVQSIDFTNWADVSARYALSSVIKWNVEYIPDFIVVLD